jgi:hypothetical protein
VKGDARSEPSSSGASNWSRLRSACERYAGRGFAGFVFLHCAAQALRALSDGAVPSAGFELTPALVAGILLLVFGPFAVFAWAELQRARPSEGAAAESAKARALRVLERPTLVLVLAFTVWHVTQIAGPLLLGTFSESDVRPELCALLSSTWQGVPLLAAGYLCGVGAASFYGARQALRALPEPRPRARARTLVALGVLASLLGCYAVIRLASGVILP